MDEYVINLIKNDDVFNFEQWCKEGRDFDQIVHFPENSPTILSHSPPIISVAAYFGASNIFRYLSFKRANVLLTDDINNPPIAFAAAGGHEEIIEIIIQMGISLCYQKQMKNVLHYASEFGNLPMLKYLVSLSQLDINSPDIKGTTPLFYAVSNSHLECIQFLLSLEEIEVNNHDNEGVTSFIFIQPWFI
ncbi:ankyrin repeat domain protein [Tritrichomonas foetus]|uniref:Ankyrin repeat domain protein n=1 Tax=Tritrichomonas foetus TaxID=1144522 RepID=A0A1J4JMY8_9EUKA|nr:ankyrin repeat domain protein [Tritrichomonas foetus]|eukprot:OHT00487.1 ankyrin repeat domain protein [Tritrichomonas foetus]